MLYWLNDWSAEVPWLNIFRYLTFRSLLAIILSYLFVIAWVYVARKRRLDSNKANGSDSANVSDVSIALLTTNVLCPNPENPFVFTVLLLGFAFAIVGTWSDTAYARYPNSKTNWLYTAIALVVVAMCALIVFSSISRRTTMNLPFVADVVTLHFPFYHLIGLVVIVGMAFVTKWTAAVDNYAIVPILIILCPLAIISYAVGNALFSEYFQIGYVAGSGELTVVVASLVGVALGCVWFSLTRGSIHFNSASAFGLGGIIGAMAVLTGSHILALVFLCILLVEPAVIVWRMTRAQPFTKEVLRRAFSNS